MGLPIESVKSNRILLVVDVDTREYDKNLGWYKIESFELDYPLELQQ